MSHTTRPICGRFLLQLGVLAAAMAGNHAWAINKCTGADGKVVFQDAPCAGRGEVLNVRPASGPAKVAPPAADAAPQAATTDAPPSKKEGAFGDSWQRRTYLENRGIPDTTGAIHAHKQSCDKKLADLRAQQGSANNNLAGATFLQSLAAEMQATATMCDVRSRELNAELDAMKKELRELQAR